MNRNRNIIRVWYEHADESAATGPDGWSRCEIRRDPDNDARINAIEFYDIAGNLTDAGGYAREEYLYKGNAVIKTRYSSTGARVSPGGDAASVQQVIRDELVTEEMYLNEAGEPTTLPEGYTGATYAYDGNDRLLGAATAAVAETQGTLTVGEGAAQYRLMLLEADTWAPLCEEWRYTPSG